MTTVYPATILCDFYKLGHRPLFPKGTEYMYVTWTPRSNKYLSYVQKVVSFGYQGVIQKWLIDYFNDHFFNRPFPCVHNEFERYMKHCLGVQNPDVRHIAQLHELGYLPIKIKALPEGILVPIKTPMMTVENTDPRFFWLPNYLETLFSSELWQPMTTASIAYEYRRLMDKYAMQTVGNTEFVKWQGHDFSLRGMGGIENGAACGAGHLLSFTGTDTIPAIAYLEEYYGADIERELVAGSVPATEHSVQCANMPEDGDEYETFKRIITEVYPTGIVSIVSDTLDFWDNINRVLPMLKETIMNRDGKVTIRPDSGNPIHILCGYPGAETEHERKGLIECLWDIFGGTVNEKGYKELDPHIGAIYGDSITEERADKIMQLLACKGFASTNVIFGIGSYTYSYLTRDSLGFAMKATSATINGEEKMLFKDPKTDDGTKRSQRGRVYVVDIGNGELGWADGLLKDEEPADGTDLLQTIFENGHFVQRTRLSEIRERLHGGL